MGIKSKQAASTDTLFNELEEELKADRAALFWKKYSDWIIGLCVVAVLATAAGVFWNQHRMTESRAATSALNKALDIDKDPVAREAALQAVAKAYAGQSQAALALLQLGADYRAAGKTAEAVNAYLTLSADAKQDPALRNLALAQALHAANDVSEKEGNAALSRTPGKDEPLYTLWREASAWRLLAEGNRAEAQTAFNEIKDAPSLAPEARARVNAVLENLAQQEPVPTPAAEK